MYFIKKRHAQFSYFQSRVLPPFETVLLISMGRDLTWADMDQQILISSPRLYPYDEKKQN